MGYDASPYAVAKTAVIAEMMKEGSAVESVLQVWYSSVWRKRTLDDFRAALTRLLASKNSPSNNKDVVRLWQHWQATDVTLTKVFRLRIMSGRMFISSRIIVSLSSSSRRAPSGLRASMGQTATWATFAER